MYYHAQEWFLDMHSPWSKHLFLYYIIINDAFVVIEYSMSSMIYLYVPQLCTPNNQNIKYNAICFFHTRVLIIPIDTTFFRFLFRS